MEDLINNKIFMPPANRKNLEQPPWIQSLTVSDTHTLTYFIIEPCHPNSQYILWSHDTNCDLYTLYDKVIHTYRSLYQKVGIICYDYYGYGWSSGTCSEDNCYNSHKYMVDFCLIALKIPQTKLFLVGHALGSGIVVDFCSRHLWVTPIFLISPYKSILRTIYDPYSFNLLSNVLLNYHDKFTTHYKIQHLKCPIIIYHGLQDTQILPYHSQYLQTLNSQIILNLLTHADHGNIILHINYLQMSDIITSYSNFSDHLLSTFS